MNIPLIGSKQDDITPGAGWALAYTTVDGPQTRGYLGRIKHDYEMEGVTLERAIEFISMIQNQNGRAARICNGSPIEFTPTLDEITVRPIAIVRFTSENATEENMRIFRHVYEEAKALRKSITQHAPKVILPNH